jgi:hypothetical protein
MSDANLGSLPGAIIISETVLAALEKKVNDIANYCTIDTSLEIGGSACTSHYVSTVPTVSTKAASGSYTEGDFALTPVTVQLGDPKYAMVSIDEVELAKVTNPRKLQDVIGGAIVTQLSKAIEDAVFAVITAANFSSSVSAPLSGFDFGGYRQLVAEGFKAAYANPSVVLNSDYIAALEKEQGFYGRTSNGAFDDGSKLVRSDRMPTANSLKGIITNGSGIVFASRQLPTPVGTKGSFMTKATDSGISVRFGTWYSEEKGKSYLKADLLMGVAKANPAGLIRVTG